jgi:ubiquinone/menaquinone biosynthesis C-methylase UbiE
MKSYVKQNLEAYDKNAKLYQEKTNKLSREQLSIRKEFMSFLKHGAKILDIGCGPGRDAKLFSKSFKVTGIDISKNMINLARKNAPKAKFRQMDFFDMDFSSACFNAVWFEAGLLTVRKKDALKLLKDIKQLLIQKGIFYVSVKEGIGEGSEFDKRYGIAKYTAYYSKRELEQLIKKAGFKILKTHILNLKPPYHSHKGINILSRK